MPDSNLKAAILQQREDLAARLGAPLRALAERLAGLKGDRAAVEAQLAAALPQIPDCKHLFVLDAAGRQIVANITREGPDAAHLGRDRSTRPYMIGLLGSTDFRLSEAYISRNSRRPMLTAVQVMRDAGGRHIGYLGADYDLRELPATQSLYRQTSDWRQIKGDPAIRRGLFTQQRVQSVMDDHLDEVLAVMNELMSERGIFHAKLHFSSSRASVWLLEDPFVYRLLDIDALLDPDTCLAYPVTPYPARAVVPAASIMPVLQLFRSLRFADETIYLRSGSLNLFNGMVSLNFSCDGTHYLRFDDFLARGLDFWAGVGGAG
jgi:hypothetical protein